jgi:hypothetical protein
MLKFEKPRVPMKGELDILAKTVTVHANPEWATGIRVEDLNSEGQVLHIVISPDYNKPQRVHILYTLPEEEKGGRR